jgi:long-chain fatty acid transport protein
LLITGGILMIISSSYAEGFRNPPAGAFNLGRAGGRIAQVDDSSAAAQNPANLVDLSGPEIQIAPSVVYISADFKSATGQSAESENPWKVLPNAFAGVPLGGGEFSLGLAVTMPYGLDSRWDDGGSSTFARPFGAWRYQSPFSTELTTVNVSPSVAAKLGDLASVGVGLDVMWSRVEFKQYYPWFLLTGNLASPDGQIRVEGDGVGVGGNFGLTLHVTEKQRLAVTFRMPLRVDYSGDFQVDNVPAALGGGSFHSDFSTSIKFPTIVAAGYGIELTDKIRVEADVEWLQFSNFKNLPLNTSSSLPGLPNNVVENWKDTFTAGIAGDWRIAPDWTLRLGYQFYQSPVPDETFSPAIPDADQNVLTFGVAWTHGHHGLEAAYGADFYASRHITNNQNPAFNGDYNITVHLFSFSYRYSF